MKTKMEWTQRISRHLLPDGSVAVPPRVARWLDSRARVLPEQRIMLRDSNPEVYEVLLALRFAALSRGDGITYNAADGRVVALRARPDRRHVDTAFAMSANGTQMATRAHDLEQSEAWLTTAEAAELAGVTDRCVRRWAATQRLPARRKGGRWLIDRQHLNIIQALAV